VAKVEEKGACYNEEGKTACSCRVESLISVDERGQMVLPKELRDRAKIKAGDKLAVITWEKDGDVCCLTLIKADDLAQGVKEFLGPVIKGLG
jgi:AbrB family looped-hinge helix DNA binding protein